MKFEVLLCLGFVVILLLFLTFLRFADRHHVHMNSTTWVTLTQYVKYLGREGICKVDQDEDGEAFIYSHVSHVFLIMRCHFHR